MSKYSEYVDRGKAKHGEKFDTSALDQRFVEYFNSGQRVKINFGDDLELTGTIGVTTGWRPCFLLMRSSRSMGSLYTLGARERIVAKQHGRQYIPVAA